MGRRARVAAAIAGAVVALAAAGVAGFALMFDPNAEKPRIADAVRRATGRDLTLAGPLRLSLGFTPAIEAQEVAFANREGGSRPQMVTVALVSARIAVLPLLTGRIEIADITLVRPDILLETDGQGVGNWQVQRPVAAGAPGEPVTPHRERDPIVIRRVTVENGRLTWRDGRTGFTEAVDVPHAQIEVGDTATRLGVDAQAGGIAAHLHAALGTADQLTGRVAGPFPVQGAVQVGDAALDLDGVTQFPLVQHGFQGRVHAAIPDLAVLAPLAQTPLPLVHDIRLDATVAGTGADPTVAAATLHIGAADLSRLLPGAALTQLDLTRADAQPARLQAEGTLGGSPWRLATSVTPSAQGVALRALSLQSAVADAQGDVAFAFNPRPSVGGTLVAHRVDLDQWPAAARAPAAAPGGVAPGPAATPAASRLFSSQPLPWATLRAMDADLALTIDTLRFAGADYAAAAAHLVLRDGAIRIAPLSLQAPEGHLEGSFAGDASVPQPSVALDVRSPSFALNALARALGLPGGSDAKAEVDVTLRSAGQSPHELASHLDGHIGLALVDGEVANAALLAALGPVTRLASLAVDPAGRSHVRCLALRLDAEQGQVTLAALRLDTSRLELDGGGSLDLGEERLALRLRPTVRVGGIGGMAPIRIDGPFAHPVASLDTFGQAGRVGVVIGGSLPDDHCSAQLAAARDGRAGRLPADAPAKPVKPADLLRSLLR